MSRIMERWVTQTRAGLNAALDAGNLNQADFFFRTLESYEIFSGNSVIPALLAQSFQDAVRQNQELEKEGAR